MANQVVLVTGCSKGGIGYEICMAFHHKGHNVFATARDLEKLEGLPDDVGKVQMDVTEEKSIENAVKVQPSSQLAIRIGVELILESAGRSWTNWLFPDVFSC